MNTKFQEKIQSAFGHTGEIWLKELPAKLKLICEEWGLLIEGEPSNLSYNYVAFVRDCMNRSLVLKVGIPCYDFNNEIIATKSFQGEGFVKIVKEHEEWGAILLERLIPGNTLKGVEKKEQVDHYLKVWNKLDRRHSDNLPPIRNWFHALRKPIDHEWVTAEQVAKAQQFMKEIEETSEGDVQLHGDLHHENILLDENHGWLAIDPKGVKGDLYFDYISFLFNDLGGDMNLLEYRVKEIAKRQQLSEERLRKAAIAMLTLQTIWAIEDGSEFEDIYNALQYLNQTV